jgi:hypothetical protein
MTNVVPALGSMRPTIKSGRRPLDGNRAAANLELTPPAGGPAGGVFLVPMRERLKKFALTLHPEKTRLIEFGRFATERPRGVASHRSSFRFLRLIRLRFSEQAVISASISVEPLGGAARMSSRVSLSNGR